MVSTVGPAVTSLKPLDSLPRIGPENRNCLRLPPIVGERSALVSFLCGVCSLANQSWRVLRGTRDLFQYLSFLLVCVNSTLTEFFPRRIPPTIRAGRPFIVRDAADVVNAAIGPGFSTVVHEFRTRLLGRNSTSRLREELSSQGELRVREPTRRRLTMHSPLRQSVISSFAPSDIFCGAAVSSSSPSS